MSDPPILVQPVANPGDRELLHCLLENIPDRIFFKDAAGRFLCVSRAEAEYFQLDDPAEVMGKTDFDFFDRELAQAAFDDEQRIMRTGVPIIGQVEKKLLLDGRTGWALVAKIPLEDTDGNVIGTCGISKDITALKETEDALQQANAELARQKDRLEETLAELKAAQEQLIELANSRWVARLAYCVAHEVRNPLNILGMGLSYLANEPAIVGNTETERIVGTMQEALSRADVVIAALMEGALANHPNYNSREIAATLDLALTMMKGKPSTPDPGS